MIPSQLAHHGHVISLVPDEELPFDYQCNGCKLPGGGASYRYRCGGQHCSLKLFHACCALKPPTATHQQFLDNTYSFEFAPPAGIGDRSCFACGKAVVGYVYHCPGVPENQADLCPCCALRRDCKCRCSNPNAARILSRPFTRKSNPGRRC